MRLASRVSAMGEAHLNYLSFLLCFAVLCWLVKYIMCVCVCVCVCVFVGGCSASHGTMGGLNVIASTW